MTHPRSNHDQRRRPRKRPRPSERNLAIHQAYRSGLRTQVELAQEFGLAQCRVSRIVAQVDQWLASDAADRGRDPDQVRSCHSRVGGSGEVREETCRELAPDVQWLKIALRGAERLQRLRNRRRITSAVLTTKAQRAPSERAGSKRNSLASSL